jgi:hypothetical protein
MHWITIGGLAAVLGLVFKILKSRWELREARHKALVRFQGVVRRAEDPKGFRWDVALYYFFGVIFIALYLLN